MKRPFRLAGDAGERPGRRLRSRGRCCPIAQLPTHGARRDAARPGAAKWPLAPRRFGCARMEQAPSWIVQTETASPWKNAIAEVGSSCDLGAVHDSGGSSPRSFLTARRMTKALCRIEARGAPCCARSAPAAATHAVSNSPPRWVLRGSVSSRRCWCGNAPWKKKKKIAKSHRSSRVTPPWHFAKLPPGKRDFARAELYFCRAGSRIGSGPSALVRDDRVGLVSLHGIGCRPGKLIQKL